MRGTEKIIAKARFSGGEGTQGGQVELVEFSDEYVCWVNFGQSGRSWGRYFPKRNDGAKAGAREVFLCRVVSYCY
jgi:hypothetical protein